jgi:hypothetical protein
MIIYDWSLMKMRSLKSLQAIILVMPVIVLSAVIQALAQDSKVVSSPASNSPIDLSNYKLHSVYKNDFSKPQKIVFEEALIEQTADGHWRRKSKPPAKAVWIAEGAGGAEIRDGGLRVAPLPFDASGQTLTDKPRSHMVVWNNRIFPDDFLLEYDMSPNGSTNGLTIVFICAAGKDGEDIFDLSLPVRRADYKTYHSGAINNYSDSYWSRNTEIESVTNRLRKNAGFKLVAEGQSLTTGATDVTHHIRILKFKSHIEIEINSKVVFKWDDPEKPLGAGRIGLRSMDGVKMITYDNFKVWGISRK